MREFTLVKTCLNFLDELRPRDKLCKHTKLSVRRRKRLLKPPRRRQVALEAQVDATSFLEQGWFVTEGFTGLQVWSVAQPMNVRDGKDDSYHFPPYQYRDHDMLWTRKGASRRPTAQEREAIMGIPVGHTRPCLPKAQQGTMKGEDLMITAASEPQVKFPPASVKRACEVMALEGGDWLAVAPLRRAHKCLGVAGHFDLFALWLVAHPVHSGPFCPGGVIVTPSPSFKSQSTQ